MRRDVLVWLAVLVLALGLAVVASCAGGGGDDDSDDDSGGELPDDFSITGTWTGTYTDSHNVTGDWSADLTDQGNGDFSGTLHLISGAYPNTTLMVTGHCEGNEITFGDASGARFDGTIDDENHMHGTWQTPDGNSGTWSGSR